LRKGRVRISEADIYEALAFARATSCETVVLAYPALPSNSQLQLGEVFLFEEVSVDKTRICGVEVEVRGISQRGELRFLVSGCYMVWKNDCNLRGII